MSNAEHLIENAIFAIKENRDVGDELDRPYNKKMLKDVGISKENIIRMANHIVYSLYEGRLPGQNEYELDYLMKAFSTEDIEEELSHYGRVWIPDSCRNCSNHPSNGGSGICNCILGGIQWT